MMQTISIRNRKVCRLFAVLLLLFGTSFMAKAQSATSRAYQVKAAFLYNFCQFVAWPEDAFTNAGDPFIIAVVGSNPFGTYLEELVSGEKLNSRPIIVKYYRSISEIENCQILFINMQNPAGAISALTNRSILSVSDAANFASMGGMICFYTENNKIRLQINLAAAKAARLDISSKLLRLAHIIE